VGKTEISLPLAETFNGEIISADSRLLYRGMDLGTAKPSPIEQARVPHHLIDVADPDETWSLAMYVRAAVDVIEDIQGRNNLPFLVGGTGQYIRAVMEGWEIPAQEPLPALREALESWGQALGPEALHRRLVVLDSEAAARIEPRNLRRTVRALEVVLGTGRKFSEQRRRRGSPYRICQLGLIRPRPELYARIDRRLEQMMAAGFLDEVQTLLARGYPPDLPAFSAIGYRELIAHLQGATTLDEALGLIRKKSRQFVRRQANWFSPQDPSIFWVEAGTEAFDQLRVRVTAFLRGQA
jgi:tRNA dimethylallyltransferase